MTKQKFILNCWTIKKNLNFENELKQFITHEELDGIPLAIDEDFLEFLTDFHYAYNRHIKKCGVLPQGVKFNFFTKDNLINQIKDKNKANKTPPIKQNTEEVIAEPIETTKPLFNVNNRFSILSNVVDKDYEVHHRSLSDDNLIDVVNIKRDEKKKREEIYNIDSISLGKLSEVIQMIARDSEYKTATELVNQIHTTVKTQKKTSIEKQKQKNPREDINKLFSKYVNIIDRNTTKESKLSNEDVIQFYHELNNKFKKFKEDLISKKLLDSDSEHEEMDYGDQYDSE